MLTPLTIARSQLRTAIDLFFDEKDPVSVHTLAGAAREILEELCRRESVEPMTDFILKDHPGKARKDIWAAMNLYRNCFKHVARTEEQRIEDEATLAQFREPINEFLLYVCVEDYLRLRNSSPVTFQIFQAWFVAMHWDLLVDEKWTLYKDKFPGLLSLPRAEQKRRGREAIKFWAQDEDLRADPRTEPDEL